MFSVEFKKCIFTAFSPLDFAWLFEMLVGFCKGSHSSKSLSAITNLFKDIGVIPPPPLFFLLKLNLKSEIDSYSG